MIRNQRKIGSVSVEPPRGGSVELYDLPGGDGRVRGGNTKTGTIVYVNRTRQKELGSGGAPPRGRAARGVR